MTEWTEARIELLRRRWGAGCTAGAIATQLGGVTRNAVMGKAHRLGLVARPSPIRADTAEVANNRKLAWERRRNGDPKPVRRSKRERVADLNGGVRVNGAAKPIPAPTPVPARLSRDACAWPIGDPKQAGFRFCGARPVVVGKPYCEAHCNQAYQRIPAPADESEAA